MSMKIPFVDLKTQYHSIQKEVDKAIREVLENTAFIGGPYVKEFEQEFQKILGIQNCIGVGNGTDALFISLKALEITRGEVIVPANTFIATAETVSAAGATPVFIDCDPNFYNIDVDKAEKAINDKTKAIIAVHLYGQPAEMDKIISLAAKYDLKVIEDVAQAHLAKYQNRYTGTFGDMSCFSFYPGKNLGAYGDAGAIITNNDNLAKKCRMLANHGRLEKYNHEFEGYNSRLDGLQAAILSVKLKHLPLWNERRRYIARKYKNFLKNEKNIFLPKELPDTECVYHLFVVRAKSRDELRNYLKTQDIDTGIHYPTALPFLPAYSRFGFKEEDFPIAARLQKEILSLPIYPEISDEQIKYISDKIKEFYVSR